MGHFYLFENDRYWSGRGTGEPRHRHDELDPRVAQQSDRLERRHRWLRRWLRGGNCPRQKICNIMQYPIIVKVYVYSNPS